MDFFRKKKEEPSNAVPTTSSSDVKSSETTPYQSGVPSEFEKEIPTEPSVHSARSKSDSQRQNSTGEVQPTLEGDNAIQSAEKKLEAVEKEEQENEDDIDYPKAMKLTLITIALCLSVFCMGRFRDRQMLLFQQITCSRDLANTTQPSTTPSSPQPSPKSPTTSAPSTTSAGMVRHTF